MLDSDEGVEVAVSTLRSVGRRTELAVAIAYGDSRIKSLGALNRSVHHTRDKNSNVSFHARSDFIVTARKR